MLINNGDLFKLGEHRLICGDAGDPEIVKKLVDQFEISLIACDPPYGVAYVESKQGLAKVSAGNKIIANDQNQTEAEYIAFSNRWLETVKPYLAKKNSVYIFNSDKKLFALREAMVQSGYRFTQLLIWIKQQQVLGRMDYLPQHELIAYGWLGTHIFHKSQDKSVLFCPKPRKSKLHPTMKPVSLMRRLILNSSQIGECVYDPFGGSGTTLIACEQIKRKCLMIELDPEYCLKIINRYEKLAGSEAVKL